MIDTVRRIRGDGKNEGNLLHGWHGTPTYAAWNGMKTRCTCPKSKAYPHYGGRGIAFVDAWVSFPQFLADMGPKPEGMTLERIDNDKGYGPENCRWASKAEQVNNRRCTIMVALYGKMMPLAEACRILGLRRHRVYLRIKAGWDHHKALFTPFINGRNQWPK